MSDWEEQISRILGDPEQMAQIGKLARSLMGEDEGGTQAEGDPTLPDLSRLLGAVTDEMPESALLERLLHLMKNGSRNDSRQQALLAAMKPYLSEKRQRKMERAMKLAHMAKLAQLAMGETGGGDV